MVRVVDRVGSRRWCWWSSTLQNLKAGSVQPSDWNIVSVLMPGFSQTENVDAVSGEQVARRVDFVPQRSDVESRELELRQW